MAKQAISEFDIWMDVIAPEDGVMRPEDAEAVLRWNFEEVSERRLKQIIDRSQGKLTKADQRELDLYSHVGQVITFLQLRARQSLKQHRSRKTR